MMQCQVHSLVSLCFFDAFRQESIQLMLLGCLRQLATEILGTAVAVSLVDGRPEKVSEKDPILRN